MLKNKLKERIAECANQQIDQARKELIGLQSN